ncbi:MAG: DMT family transporter [Bacteroidales bacterium]|nr:DMT family transporter [Bacteroidales bacterium]
MKKSLFSKIDALPYSQVGVFFVFIEILSLTVVYLSTKLLLNNLSFPVFGFYWFLSGFFWNLLIVFFDPKTYQSIIDIFRFPLFMFSIGFLDAVATVMWFKAIESTPNPSIVSFMTNVSPIYALILGYIFHKERFKLLEVIGMVITFAGLIMISYQKNITVHGFMFENAGIILISSLISQAGKTILKYRISSFHPVAFAVNRLFFLLSFVIIFLMLEPKKYNLSIPFEQAFLIFLASFFGPFLATIAGYKALSLLKMSTYSFLSSVRSLFVLIASFIFLHKLPLVHQTIGGLLTIIGFLFISMKNKYYDPNKNGS